MTDPVLGRPGVTPSDQIDTFEVDGHVTWSTSTPRS